MTNLMKMLEQLGSPLVQLGSNRFGMLNERATYVDVALTSLHLDVSALRHELSKSCCVLPAMLAHLLWCKSQSLSVLVH